MADAPFDLSAYSDALALVTAVVAGGHNSFKDPTVRQLVGEFAADPVDVLLALADIAAHGAEQAALRVELMVTLAEISEPLPPGRLLEITLRELQEWGREVSALQTESEAGD